MMPCCVKAFALAARNHFTMESMGARWEKTLVPARPESIGISDLVVECIVAIDVTCVRFLAGALLPAHGIAVEINFKAAARYLASPICISCSIMAATNARLDSDAPRGDASLAQLVRA